MPSAIEQRDAALAKANVYRVTVGRKIREIGAMAKADAESVLADLIETADDPALLSGNVARYIAAIPGRGPAYVDQVLRTLEVRDARKRLRDLTERQRKILAAEIRRNR